jgi:hypothetical protein
VQCLDVNAKSEAEFREQAREQAMVLVCNLRAPILEHLRCQRLADSLEKAKSLPPALQDAIEHAFTQSLRLKAKLDAAEEEVDFVWPAPGQVFEDKTMSQSHFDQPSSHQTSRQTIGLTTLSRIDHRPRGGKWRTASPTFCMLAG